MSIDEDIRAGKEAMRKATGHYPSCMGFRGKWFCEDNSHGHPEEDLATEEEVLTLIKEVKESENVILR